MRYFTILLMTALICGLSSTATAATLGMPIFTTAPSTVYVTNEFGPNLMPTPSYTVHTSTTIASAQGAPDLVGQTLDFTYFQDLGFSPPFASYQLRIAGIDIMVGPTVPEGYMDVILPYVETYDPISGDTTFTYQGVFSGWGSKLGDPFQVLAFTLSAALPTLDGYQYCNADFSFCEFSNTPGLTDISGVPVTLNDSYLGYPEGQLRNATLTFSTLGGRQVAPVPLPAGGLLLAAALAGLGWRARRRTLAS